MGKILAIDDDPGVLRYLFVLLMQTGKYEVKTLEDSTKALQELDQGRYDVLLLDMDMPRVTGLDILKYAREHHPDLETIVLTGVEDVQLAVTAMKLGSYDYLSKPVNNDLLLLVLERALERRHLKDRVQELREDFKYEDLKNKEAFQDIITRSPAIIKVLRYVERIASSQSSVLIWGESGTGKELIARAIHSVSPRKNERFIAVNAGVFANELFASEFFGHMKGSFSGAYSDQKGFLEAAHRGTLFLDEIGELSLPIQVKLLRVLQEGEYFRLGSTQNQKVDVRIIASTNKDLQVEIKKGNFRKDLFFRLNINSIYLLPLREHKEDIPLLAYHFLDKYNKINKKQIREITEPVMNLLQQYTYPGNIRELENIINNMVSVETSDKLTKSSLPSYFSEACRDYKGLSPSLEEKTLQELEREYIGKILEKTGGNRTRAAKILGISRVNLISKIKRYQLS
ncbi:MAG: sigma-54-dependent Fis family transcriptional regulator [Deltaproteobacteria bacterium]|nr:sigma-54-dependent Fis family transcriptional regulator [Deltaproteobacteria bacterium]